MVPALQAETLAEAARGVVIATMTMPQITIGVLINGSTLTTAETETEMAMSNPSGNMRAVKVDIPDLLPVQSTVCSLILQEKI